MNKALPCPSSDFLVFLCTWSLRVVLSVCLTATAPGAIAQQNTERDLVKALSEALKKEKDPVARIILAKALVRVAPDDKNGAQELVKALTTKGDLISTEGYKAIAEIIPASPPALVAALIPVLKHSDEVYRRQAAELLSKINQQGLNGLRYYDLCYNDVRQKSAHNAYERSISNNVYEDIFDLVAYWRIRSIELDIHHGKGPILPGDWRIYHTDAPGLDGSSVTRLSVALDLLAGVHQAIPGHEVMTVFIDLKDPFSQHHPGDLLDRMIRDKLGDDLLYTPGDLLGAAANLQGAVTGLQGWPRLAELRGKFLFVLTGDTEALDDYTERGAKASQRVAFIAPEISDANQIGAKDYAVFFNLTTDTMAILGPKVFAARFVSRAYKINTASDWMTAVGSEIHHLATDKHNSDADRWSRTHNDIGWPFEEILPSTNPQFSERGNSHTLSVKSGDFTGKVDSGFFVYSECPSQDAVELVAYIAVPSSHVEDNAKGLVMVRASLDSDAPYFAVLKPADNGGPRIQYRAMRGGDTMARAVDIIEPDLLDAETPGLVKLQVTDNHRTVTAWASLRGGSGDWKIIGQHTFGGCRMKYIGLAASSLDKSKAAKVHFGIVKGLSQWASQDAIGQDVSFQRWDKGIRP